jgi:hypothetical protein
MLIRVTDRDENLGRDASYGNVKKVTTSSLDEAGEPVRRRPEPLAVDRTDTAAEWMPAELFEAWQVVARDLNSRDAIIPHLAESDWSDDPDLKVTAMAWWPDGTGAGIGVAPHEPLAERIALLADDFQVEEVKALWAAKRPPVWPQCPSHLGSHPLTAAVRDGVAVWLAAS